MKKIFHKLDILSKKRLFFVLLLGLILRVNGVIWDQGYHLHPDERFLTMVGTALKIPKSFSEYLDPGVSTLNPENIGNKFFVYGVLPLTLNKIPAVIFGNDNYEMYTIQGRLISALFDVMVVYLIYKSVEILEKKYNLNVSFKLWASFLYAISVLPIQLSHYFATDSFLNAFMFASFYFALKFFHEGKIKNIVGSAIFFGFAIASKLSALFILPVLIFHIIFSDITPRNSLTKKLFYLILFFVISYFSTRLSDPYMFASANILDPRMNATFLQSIHDLKNMVNKDAWFPPAVQWVHKTAVIFSLANLAILGIGLPHFLFVLIGMYFVLKGKWLTKMGKSDIFKKTKTKTKFLISVLRYYQNILFTPLVVMVFWVTGFFLYQSTQFVKIMRYFIFIYPFLAIIAGFGIVELFNIAKKMDKKRLFVFKIIVIVALLVWPIAFSSIYIHKHSRVEASEWIYDNFPDKSVISNEHWDDGLPLPMVKNYGKTFIFQELPVFGFDDKQKWDIMNDLLNKGNYYILSSNRGWGSMPTVPERYPKMTLFYMDLFDDKTQYKKIKEFTSYPRICIFGESGCLVMNDDWSDESFTVYDHPKVIIFQKKGINE